MSGTADAFARAAEALLGTPFRLLGRSERGVDCVGLVALALARAGIVGGAPVGYGLRNIDIERHLVFAARYGFRDTMGSPERGDVVLTTPGPSQHHLLIALGSDVFVHAHAGLRRVATHGGSLPGPVLRHWRLETP